jgi:ribosomal protein L1
MARSKIFYAKHKFTTTTEVVIRIKALNEKDAQEINDNWSYPTPHRKNITVISKDVDGDDYSASKVREHNNFYD